MRKRIILIIGIVLILVGAGLLGWKLYTDWQGQQQMESLTDQFDTELASGAIDDGPVLEGSTIAILEFPKFNERIAVTEAKGRDEYLGGTLSYSASHMLDTAYPWDATGNCCIAAHNDTFFKNVHNFEIGDEIFVKTKQGTYKYTVFKKESIDPTQVEILEPTEAKQLTLITCNFSGSQRVIVFGNGGELVEAPTT